MAIEVWRPTDEELAEQAVFSWPTWSCEVSTFDWVYEARETCYLLAGRVTVESDVKRSPSGRGIWRPSPRGSPAYGG